MCRPIGFTAEFEFRTSARSCVRPTKNLEQERKWILTLRTSESGTNHHRSLLIPFHYFLLLCQWIKNSLWREFCWRIYSYFFQIKMLGINIRNNLAFWFDLILCRLELKWNKENFPTILSDVCMLLIENIFHFSLLVGNNKATYILTFDWIECECKQKKKKNQNYGACWTISTRKFAEWPIAGTESKWTRFTRYIRWWLWV